MTHLALVLGLAAGLGAASSSPILDVPPSAWSDLNSKVSGGLHAGRPFALPCFDTYQNSSGTFPNDADAGRCQTVEQSLAHSQTLIGEFGAYHNPSFSTCMATGEKCSVSPGSNATSADGTCFQGTVPDYYADTRNVEDIQAALKFARKHKLPVTVKNTGHDYKGRSTSPGSLGIWTHNIQPELALEEDFTPETCAEPAGPAVTYGAGQVFNGIYDFLADKGYMMVGGSCPTVGASGGYVAGGGYSALTPYYGLGVDNVLQMKVVLPNGTFITANRCQNQDMFFALRGGGGGTFGVVTETTSKAIKDDRPVTLAILAMAVPGAERNATEVFVDNAVQWATDGWSGSLGVRDQSAASFAGLNFDLEPEAAAKSLQPIIDLFDSLAADSSQYTKQFVRLPSYYAFQNSPVNQAFVARGIGLMAAQSSRLIPKENFATDDKRSELVDVLVRQPFGAMLSVPHGFKLPASDAAGGPGESSVTPAWRDAIWHLVYQTIWDPADPKASSKEAQTAAFKKVSEDMDRVRDITPNSGAYQNEGDTYEPDPAGSFWGKANYERLLDIKTKLDPDNLLSCFRCLGWQESNPRHQCYPKI